jgi:hypothetical protein
MGGVTFQVEQRSVDAVESYLERTRQRILSGIRTGMQEAMEGLAFTVADKLQGNPIVSRSGELLGAILASPKVTETPQVIRGTVTADVGKKHLGIWLEEGTHVPAVEGHLYQFTPADGETVYTRGHRAFDVKPHPFMNPSLREFKAPIMEIIQARVAEAYE